jgi:PiT family inorganic phosphate transporter
VELLGVSHSPASGVLLLIALGLALAFEFVNGFHDTANAVATVIYTHSLPPGAAVVWSGLWNLIGVLTSTGAVAFGITALLPSDLVLEIGSAAGFAMVFSLLTSAIVWNVGTWYFGIPASSSHSLIGAILGVGLANSLITSGNILDGGLNWKKAGEVGLSLLFSPLAGFALAALLLLLTKKLASNPDLFQPPDGQKPPPLWIRGILLLTCTGVSFAHGSNDGQKGMGLIMLILVGIVPATYALNGAANPRETAAIAGTVAVARRTAEGHSPGPAVALDRNTSARALVAYAKSPAAQDPQVWPALASTLRTIERRLLANPDLTTLNPEARKALRGEIVVASAALQQAEKDSADAAQRRAFHDARDRMVTLIQFIPAWVKIAVALALGLGTTIGWKRIVVTVGEKIGKAHLSYAQGASAEMVAMATIGAADVFGLPVSTTHVLSSGVAGAMAANRSGVQMATIRNLFLAWVLTLPVCVTLGALLFAFALNILAAMGLN